MSRTILSIGEGARSCQVNPALEALHAARPIDRVLVAQGGVTGSYVGLWARRDSGGCVIEGWPGDWAIRARRRPPVCGIDRLRAVLADARALGPELVVWGDLPAFWDNRRMREWDVPQARIIEEAVRFGYRGWGLLDDGLVPFAGAATVGPCVDASPGISPTRSSSSSTSKARSPTPTIGFAAAGPTIPSMSGST